MAHVRQSGGPCETELSTGLIPLKPTTWALLESWFAQTKAKCTLDSSKMKLCEILMIVMFQISYSVGV
jgi:hypothetical protein